MQSDRDISEAAPSGSLPIGPGPTTEDHGDGEPHEHIHLPPPSVWPITMASGLGLGGMGLVTIWPVSLIGGFLFALALVKWIQELRIENPVEGTAHESR
jgi:hypothetical protein